jgi:elongation factor 3
MHDLKKQVKEKAIVVMEKLLKCNGNNDLDPFIPVVLDALQNLNNIPFAVEKLAGCVFVQNVEFRALAVTLPILERGLKDNITEIRRKSCVIIDNMCKLIEDPKEIYPLMPILKPLVENCAKNISNPEARSIAEKSLNTLNKACGEGYKPKKYNLEDILVVLKSQINKIDNVNLTQKIDNLSEIILKLSNIQYFEYNIWSELFSKYLVNVENSSEVCKVVFENFKITNDIKDDRYIDNEEGTDLYQGEFSLAYGALTLLNNTFVHLKKNRFYGLLGPNNCGKTTLMRAIANEQVEGFPKRDELKTVFVEHEIQEREVGEDEKGYPIFNIDLCGIDWVVDCCNEVYKMEPKVKREDVERVMEEIGFGNSNKDMGKDRAADAAMGVTTYSGGWKMKMQLCAATLMNADILMLDEPTGHLDVTNIAWIKGWLNNFRQKGGSIICTSHDSSFLNEMCSHIIDFQNRKLVMFRSKDGEVLKQFVEKYPEKKGYFELKNDVMKFDFPDPGRLEGSKCILKMKQVTFQYPIRDKPTVMDISLSCSTSSRVSVIGPNGAGKSTAIKLLIGELKPSTGEVWKNPNSRIAYVAQHAFQHLEKHITKTPTQYILWRFAGNDDKESVDFKADIDEENFVRKKYFLKLEELTYDIKLCRTPEQEKKAVSLDKIVGRRNNKKEKTKEYEVCWKNMAKENTMWVRREILMNMGCIKEVQRFDEKMAAAAGLMDKSLTSNSIEKHLAGFGIDPEQASHTLIGSLSGGQKVKVVLAASLWLNPHLIILDEPTNYLDRDGLGALTKAIEEFKGGVVTISHNREFANAVSQEKWIMEAGRLRKEGESTANLEEDDTNKPIETSVVKDSWGNEIEVDKTQMMGEKAKNKEIKNLQRAIKRLKKKKGSEDEIYELEDKIAELMK